MRASTLILWICGIALVIACCISYVRKNTAVVPQTPPPTIEGPTTPPPGYVPNR